MITVRLIGGLGNQMFQFAAGRRLALHRNVPLRLDLGWFGNQRRGDTERRYELHVFAGDLATTKVCVPLPEPRTRRELARQRVAEYLGRRPHVIRQHGNGFDPSVLDAPDGAHLVGYWQSERYFSDIAATIRRDFALRVPLSLRAQEMADAIGASESAVSLHVRRGDYVSNPAAARYHGLPGVEYYREAADLIARRSGHRIHLFVFSDDPAWCESELALGHERTIVRDNEGHEDLALMSMCRHHIIANSSFSWWGAWLDSRPDAIVVAPRRWAQGADDFDDVYLPSWVRM